EGWGSSPPVSPGEALQIDRAPSVSSLAYPALPVMRFDGEENAAALDFDDASARHNRSAHRRRREMADIDLAADRHPAGRQMTGYSRSGGDFHRHDHHWRAVDERHALDMAADGQVARDHDLVAPGHARAHVF